MISTEEAQNLVFKESFQYKTLTVPILESLGKVLAKDIMASEDIPICDNSSVDGYAVISDDTKGADENYPVKLSLSGTKIPAGRTSLLKIDPGFCIPIMTGGVIPAGADAVIRKEEIEKEKDSILVFCETGVGKNIRKRGEDIKKGQAALLSGDVVAPACIGLLASLGIERLEVFRPPEVGIISTGDELIDISYQLKRGKVRDSNSYSLSSHVMETGAEYKRFGIIPDRKKPLEEAIRSALAETDILLISGGTSVGDYDLVKDALYEIGADLIFWKVRQKPGKPLAFFRYKNKFIFGIPGNPVSAMVCFEMYVRPIIKKMMGFKEFFREKVNAEALHDFKKEKGWTNFARVIVENKSGDYYFNSAGPKGSDILTSLVKANGIALFPPELEKVSRGQKAEVYLL